MSVFVSVNGIFCLFLVSLVYCGEQQKPKLLYAETCPLTNETIDTENRLPTSVILYKDRVKQYINLTFTIFQPTQFEFRVRGYRVLNLERRISDRKIDFVVDNITCTNPVVALLLKKAKVKYVKTNCTGLPGHYSPRINMDDFYRYYINAAAAANFKWYSFETEFFTAKGIINCISYTFFFPGK